MNWWQKFVLGVGSVLSHIFGNNDSTGLTTFNPGSTKFTTPVIVDTTTLAIHSPETTSRILSTLSSTYASTAGHEAKTKVTGETGETVVTEFWDTSSANPLSTKQTGGTSDHHSTRTGATSGPTSGTPQTAGTTDIHDKTVGSSDQTEGTTHGTGGTTGGTQQTGGSSDQSEGTPHGTGGTTGGTQPTGGSSDQTEGTGGTTATTDAAPTKKPALSRGAVAGIVIGCLLLIAVVAAAVVFFIKNRNVPPEAQRLRV